MSAETTNKLLELIAVEDNRLLELSRQKRSHQSRESAFNDALTAINGEQSPSKLKLESSLKEMIANEGKKFTDTELKIEDANARKAALEELIASLTGAPSRPPPPRRPDFDYSRKDLREGTDIYRVRELLRKVGAPMLLSDIVKELFNPGELDVKHGKYANLRGTIVGYAKENRVFKVESKSPHVIGLLEFGERVLKVSSNNPWEKL